LALLTRQQEPCFPLNQGYKSIHKHEASHAPCRRVTCLYNCEAGLLVQPLQSVVNNDAHRTAAIMFACFLDVLRHHPHIHNISQMCVPAVTPALACLVPSMRLGVGCSGPSGVEMGTAPPSSSYQFQGSARAAAARYATSMERLSCSFGVLQCSDMHQLLL
jgi:hypothetical protein